MKAAEKLPVEYIEANNDDGDPVVTLIGADISEAYLDDAEPSPTMAAIGRFWTRIIKTAKFGLVLALVGGYPAMIAMSHKVDSSAVVLSSATPWYSNDTGTAMTLLGRELTVAGWANDRSWWHPQAQLTKGLGGFLDELNLYQRWSIEAQAELRSSADRAEGWPASRQDIQALYQSRARAQVASQLLMSSLIQEPELVRNRDAREARDRAIFAWRRAATFNPMIMSSQAGTGAFLSDHPAAMMYYLSEIDTATADFVDALEQQDADVISVADASAAD